MQTNQSRKSSQVIQSYLAAFSTGVAKTVAAHVAEDFINEHLGLLGGGCVGKSAYEKRLEGFLASFQNLRYEVLAICAEEDKGSARYQMHFKQGGKDFEVPGIMWFALSDGLITKRTDCWDGLTYLKQAEADAAAIAAML